MICRIVGISPILYRILDQLTDTRGIFCYGLICSCAGKYGIEELGYRCFSASGGISLGSRAWVFVDDSNSYGPGFFWTVTLELILAIDLP